MRPLRDETGLTSVPTLGALLVVLLLASATLFASLRSVESSRRDGQSTRASAAADAGIDEAGYLLNRTLVSQGTAGLVGVSVDTLRSLGCLSISTGGGAGPATSSLVIRSGTPNGWCPALLEGETDGATWRATVSTNVNVGGSLGQVVVRRVVSTGVSSDGVKRRVLAVFYLDVDPAKPTTLFTQRRFVECPPEPSGSAPDSGCPSL